MDVEFLKTVWFEECDFEDVQQTPPGILAKRDGLSFKKTNNTTWLKIMVDNECVAVSGFIVVKPKVGRLKSTFVLPEWRRLGIQTYSTVYWMVRAQNAGFTKLVGIARPTSRAARLKLGWVDRTNMGEGHIEYDMMLMPTCDTLIETAVKLREIHNNNGFLT